ncbi:hypothetical protein GMORB2_0579 [Geosmithia morbida]|uniref:BZIP domain-containing protein n=1 Tax=Geosmithia morbida TaxID=1094350 RepID=A0A9P5D559_9HYPO|nr:uncharacterized protein GMORB2_0579 [Geosmithia morbida]KAF4126842.1 hypothetical protein GMORB2_0579 [Geosmithia morbida]
MSTPSHQANLARIRDNQRRSRARKREYLQELEHRLRVCELQGIEASTEVQVAARRVAEENRHLRGLLNRQGIGDDYIANYLQTAAAAQTTTEPPSATASVAVPGSHALGASTSQSVQSLQQQLKPRRPAAIDQSAAFPMSVQTSPQDSIGSVSTTASSLWETPPQHHIQPPPAMAAPSGMMASYPMNPSTAPRMDAFMAQPAQHHPQQQQSFMEHPRHQGFSIHPPPPEMAGSSVSYDPNAPFTPDSRDYGQPRGYR